VLQEGIGRRLVGEKSRKSDAIMAKMQRSRRETEIKLRFDTVDEARRRVELLGGSVIDARQFEDNIVYDRDQDPLKPAGKLLRLRRTGSTALLTFKAPVEGKHRHKVRQEQETTVDDAEAVEALLEGLGFRPIYRYQKYRTVFEAVGLHVCLDETPIGCFVELEGAPEAIDRAAQRIGVHREDYVVETYRELQERYAAERGVEAGDMVFDPPVGG
jgi:adenylate cyclase class 2